MKDTLTMHLTGEVSLDEFVKAVARFQTLITRIQYDRASKAKIDWIVSDLQPGSAMATVRGHPLHSTPPSDVESVVNGYEDVARALPTRDFSKLPTAIRDAVFELSDIMNGHVKTVWLETSEVDGEIDQRLTSAVAPQIPRDIRSYVGSVRGTVQALNNRGELRFTLYDVLHDRAVSCYLQKGCEEHIRDKWGKRVSVSGMVRRDSEGRPVTVRDIRAIEVIEGSSKFTWREARGCAPALPNSISPEEAVRRGRDD